MTGYFKNTRAGVASKNKMIRDRVDSESQYGRFAQWAREEEK